MSTADLNAMFPPPPKQPDSKLQLMAQEWNASVQLLGATGAEVVQASYVFFTYACDHGGLDPLYVFKLLLENNRGRITT